MNRNSLFDDDLKYVFYMLLAGVYCFLVISRQLALGLFVIVFLYSAMSGVFILFTESKERQSSGSGQRYFSEYKRQNISQTSSAPLTDEPTIADRIKEIHKKNDFKCPNCGATVLPTDMVCKHCGSVLVASVNLPKPEAWADVEVGQAVTVKHPKQGEMNLSVKNRIYYGELWQAQMRPNVPWTLTGNYYVRLGFSDDTYLLNWQNRFYFLDSQSFVTDMDINRDFARSAREFAASNQTKDVSFTYNDVLWKIIDIGRFRIEHAEGDGIKVSAGAVGRFIHMTHKAQVMVVEDFQTGGGGLDRLWKGYQITEQDIQF